MGSKTFRILNIMGCGIEFEGLETREFFSYEKVVKIRPASSHVIRSERHNGAAGGKRKRKRVELLAIAEISFDLFENC